MYEKKRWGETRFISVKLDESQFVDPIHVQCAGFYTMTFSIHSGGFY